MRVYLLLCHLSVIYAVFFFYFLQFCGTRFNKYIIAWFSKSLKLPYSDQWGICLRKPIWKPIILCAAKCKLRPFLKVSSICSKFSVSVSFSLTNFAFEKRENYISRSNGWILGSNYFISLCLNSYLHVPEWILSFSKNRQPWGANSRTWEETC